VRTPFKVAGLIVGLLFIAGLIGSVAVAVTDKPATGAVAQPSLAKPAPKAARITSRLRADRSLEQLRVARRVGFANSGGLVFVDESAEEVATV
jgi:hypothetical protein